MNATHMIMNAGPMKASKGGGLMTESRHGIVGSSWWRLALYYQTGGTCDSGWKLAGPTALYTCTIED